MRKAKLILSAIAIFAVVGGALAFKARFLPSNVFTRTTTTLNGPLVCIPTAFATTTTTQGTLANVYTTRPCTQLVATYITDSDD